MTTISEKIHPDTPKPLETQALLDPEWRVFIQPLELVHNFVALCKADCILYLNPAGLNILGVDSLEKIVNQPIANFIHHDYSEIAELGLELFAEEDTVISLKFLRLDEQSVDVEIWVSEVSIGGEKAYLLEAKDITGHIRAAQALRTREQRLEGILNTVADGVLTLDNDGNIQTFNPAAEIMFGFKSAEVIGKNIRKLIAPIEEEDAAQDEKSVVTENPLHQWVSDAKSRHETTGLKKDGRGFPVEMAVREFQHNDDVTYTSIVRDITIEKKAAARIYHLAHHDTLTGLPNRHLFGDRLDEAIKRAHRHETIVALMFIDLNKFKPINDTLGHDAGDEALKEVAKRLQFCLRGTDTIARIGGDEFVAILEDLDTPMKGAMVAKKILKSLEKPMTLAGQKCVLGASIGISIFPNDAKDVSELLHLADQAMYKVKESDTLEYAYYNEPEQTN
ncbi:MAG: diguanylate cyclase [Alphaproteobacteria bacterium]|nr:diguanylate cyclase [Alphaproteobacteria bacterium]